MVNRSRRLVDELGNWQWCDQQLFNRRRCVLLPAGAVPFAAIISWLVVEARCGVSVCVCRSRGVECWLLSR